MTDNSIENTEAPVNTGLVDRPTEAPVANEPVAVAPVVDSAPIVADEAPKLFKDSLSDEYKNDQSFSTFKDADAMAKSYKNLQQLASKKITDLSPDELVQINRDFGAPNGPEGYEFKESEFVTKEANDEVAKIAHEIGIPANQMAKLHEWYLNDVSKKMEINTDNEANVLIEQENNLKKELGAAFDENIDYAEKAINKYGGQELMDVLHNSKIATNPTLVKAFADIGKLMSDDKKIGSEEKQDFTLTPAEAQNELTDFRHKYHKELNSAFNPQHDWAIQKLHKLTNASKGVKV